MTGMKRETVKSDQRALFETQPQWAEPWKGMPDYFHKDLSPYQSIVVHFRDLEDRQEFAALVGQQTTPKTKSMWYPAMERASFKNREYESAGVNPRYPVYIVSKGRAKSRMTSNALERMSVPYWIVVEPQEYDEYVSVIDPEKVLVLPFSNLGQGSVPARNWIWEHSLTAGANRHWILDDNIQAFYQFNENEKRPVIDGEIFRSAEEFTDRYDNIAISGFNYHGFVKSKWGSTIPPFKLNTRIYSCILIDNSLECRWRGRYNEDTDLCIRALKSGLCTVLFNAFLAEKVSTNRMSGGNHDDLYKGSGRVQMAESLKLQHPDIVTVTEKFGRAQHHVDYSVFKRNALKHRREAREAE
jgi:hypothetical protein